METDPTLTNEEIQPSNPQSTAEVKDAVELKEPTTEKRKREEEEEEKDNPSEPLSDPGKHPLWKTSLCSYFRRPPGGICRHGDTCRYAHGEEELRPRPDNSWDPTSDRAKKIQKTNGSKPDLDEEEGEGGEEEEEEDEDMIIGDGDDSTSLDKCLIGLPRNWGSDTLKMTLDAQASY